MTMSAYDRYFALAGSGEKTERAAAFSDAVFAIAMTLLALTIEVPRVPAAELPAAVLGQWVQVAAYALSFMVVGAYWLMHHRLFTILDRFTIGLLRLNLVALLLVGLVPYGTSLLVRYAEEPLAVTVYAVILAAIGLAQAGLWLFAWRDGLLNPAVDRGLFRFITARSLAVPVVFLASVPVAFVNADAAKYLWVLLFIVELFLTRRSRAERPGSGPGSPKEL